MKHNRERKGSNLFSKNNPSPKYLENLEMYKQMHVEGEKRLNLAPEDTFNGQSLIPQLEKIQHLCVLTDATSVLDYGSGKGLIWREGIQIQFSESRVLSAKDFLNIRKVVCYDPAYEPFSAYPSQKCDGVICTDVLEHIPENDIDWFIGELFHFADKFVFANIACYPAVKTLPNGENAHCTIKEPQWWIDIFQKYAHTKPEIKVEIWIQYLIDEQLQEQRVANF
jgi:hypothetical protein